MQHVDDALLIAYADDELTASERGEVEAHLVSCAECRARVDEERALAARAAGVLGIGEPEFATVPPFEDVLRRSDGGAVADDVSPGAPPVAGRSWRPLALAATLIVALGAGWIARVLLSSPEFNAPARSQTEAIELKTTAGDDAAAGAASESAQAAPDSVPQAFGVPAQEPEAGARDLDAREAEGLEPAAPPAAISAAPLRAEDSTTASRARVAAEDPAAVRQDTGAALLQRRAAAEEREPTIVASAAAPPPPAAGEIADATGLGVVTGRIFDATTRQPLVGGQVTVAGTGIGALTGPEGEFVLRGVPPGRREVEVALIGYNEVSLAVSVPPDSSVSATFAMRPASVALDAITITGAAAPAAAGLGIPAAQAEWQGSSLAAAAERGAVVYGLPGAPVELVWIATASAHWQTRVIQRVDGAAIEIVALRSLDPAATTAAGRLPDGRSYLFTTSGGVPVLVRGSPSVERLRALAGRVQPLP